MSDLNIVNGRCHAKKAPDDGPPLFQHGNLVFQAHHVGWIITGFFTLASIVASGWLINKHIQWYTNKREQRYIVRILLMVPIYALVSFLSYLFWDHSTPLLLLRDCYESTVLTSFFYLLLMYLSHDPHEQKEVFRKYGLSRENNRELRKKGEKPKKWVFPLGPIKWVPQDGLYFLQLMKWGVLQYCVVRPSTTIAAVSLDYAGLYCEDSWSPGWGHIYITVIVSLSVTVAMYCLIQLYVPVSKLLQPRKPLLKLFAIKAVVFLTFWQATALSFLTMFGLVKDTPFMTADNINIGIGAILETFEMMIFAFLHIKAFTYKPYRDPPNRTPRFRSFIHAMNFKETFRELWAGFLYMIHRWRGRETDVQARREAALGDVFGRTRYDIQDESKSNIAKGKGTENETHSRGSLSVSVDVDRVVHVGAERQWLGVGDDYGYGLGYRSRKEKSESLEVQIERELAKRGYVKRDRSEHRLNAGMYDRIELGDVEQAPPDGHSREPKSWWRNLYNRISQSGDTHDQDLPDPLTPPAHRKSRTRGRPTSRGNKPKHTLADIDVREHDLESSPPPSAIRTYREKRSRRASGENRSKQTEVVESHPPLIGASFLGSPPRPVDIPLSPPPSPGIPVKKSSRPAPKRKPAPENPVAGPSTPPLSPAMSPQIPTVLLSPASVQSEVADSFFDRAFALRSDASHSAEALSAGPSDQSHHTHLHLGGDHTVLANRMVVSQSPIILQGPHPVASHENLVELAPASLPPPDPFTPPKERARSASKGRRSKSRHNSRGERDITQQANLLPPGPYLPPKPQSQPFLQLPPHIQHAPRGMHTQPRPQAVTSLQPQPWDTPRPGYRPGPSKPDRIVLPTPLSPVAGPSTSREDLLRRYLHNPPSDIDPNMPVPTPIPPPSRRSHVDSASKRSHGDSTVPPSSRSHSSSNRRSSRDRKVDTDNPTSPPALRRSKHNVKRHSYAQGQQPRDGRTDKPSRRVSAPPLHEVDEFGVGPPPIPLIRLSEESELGRHASPRHSSSRRNPPHDSGR